MQENIEISVVIPTYNRCHVVGRAIESALAQEYAPAEIIVIDDGSVDNTRELLESFGNKIRWIYQSNAGVSAARNRGVRESKSDWIAFLDSDDYWLPQHLGRIVRAIRATGGEAALYFADLQVPRQEGGGRYWSRCEFEIEGDYELKRDPGAWIFLRIQPMMLQASVVARKAYLQIGGLSERLRTREDTLFFFQLGLLYPVCAVSGCGTVMNSEDDIRLTQIYNKRSVEHFQATFFLFDALLANSKETSPERRRHLREALAASHFGAGRVFIRQRKYLSAARNLALSCRISPSTFAKEFRGAATKSLKPSFRAFTLKFGYAVFDVRKDQSPFAFLPGHLGTILRNLDVNCVIDVGANRGQFASMIRNAGYTGRIVSVEPVSEPYIALCRRFQDDPSWHGLNIALGEREETKAINVFASDDLSSFLEPSVNMGENLQNSYVTNSQIVPIRRLESVFDRIVEGLARPRVFLKLDTQGYDLRVVRGAGDSLHHIVGIESELSVIPLYEGMPDYLEALTFYRHLGFEPTGIFPLERNKKNGHVLEFEAVLTRRRRAGKLIMG